MMRRVKKILMGGMALCVLWGVGCVERTMTITSDPPGTLVYLNDEEVGRTPVKVPFTFYGVYDVRLEHEGFAPLWVKREAEMPWWEFIGPDIVAEAIPHAKSEVKWHFTMQLKPTMDEANLVERARQMRADIPGNSSTQPSEDNR